MARIAETWVFTVGTLTYRAAAISAFALPRPTSTAISRSRSPRSASRALAASWRRSLPDSATRAMSLRVTSEAGNGAEVLPLVDRHAPHVVLMDIRMPVMDGLAATEALRARPRSPQVIVLTTFDADRHALRAGAAGFLLKDTPPDEIVTAVRQVACGRPVLSPLGLAERAALTGGRLEHGPTTEGGWRLAATSSVLAARLVTLAPVTPDVIDVLVVDDDPVVRFGLVMMLRGAPDIRVVAEVLTRYAADGDRWVQDFGG